MVTHTSPNALSRPNRRRRLRILRAPRAAAPRAGKTLVLFAILLPVLLAVTGLVLDGGQLQTQSRYAQHVADAAATAAASALHRGMSIPQATAVAEQYIRDHHDLPDSQIQVQIPPATGPYQGTAGYVEVDLRVPVDTHFVSFVGSGEGASVRARAVAGARPVTASSAVIVLDPDPPQIAVAGVGGVLPALPTLIAGLELENVGRVLVDGAVLVNTEWGGVDEDGQPAGSSPPPPFAAAGIGLPINNRLRARDIRVVGGVDQPESYGPFDSGESNPLSAGRLPVPDPLEDLPVPTLSADSLNVSADEHGGVTIANLPLLPTETLQPGVYEWITVVSGNVRFLPGVYIIRGRDPATGTALALLAGQVQGDGVMFYITNTPTYSPATGLPDGNDGTTPPPAPGALTLVPSAVINLALPGSRLSPLDDPGSPFDGMLLYQRRADRRPLAIVSTPLLLGGGVSGTVYAKWGHAVVTGNGNIGTSFVVGSMRFAPALDLTVAPADLHPPARDVFLVE